MKFGGVLGMDASCRYICDDIQRDYILGYTDSEQKELYEYIKIYMQHKGTTVFLNKIIEAPSFDEVELIMSCISTKDVCTMQNNELRGIIAKFYPDISFNLQSTIVKILLKVIEDLKNNRNLNNTLIKNAFVKVLKAIDSTFLEVVKLYDKTQESHIIYYGDVSKYDLLTMEVLIHMGIDVVILSKSEKEIQSLTGFKYNICKGEYTDFSYLIDVLEGNDIGSPVECNTWIKVKEKDSLENYIEAIFKKPLRIEGEGKRFRTVCIGFTGVLNEDSYKLALYNFYLANKDNWLLIEGKFDNPTYEEVEEYKKVYSNYESFEKILDEYYYFMHTAFPKRVNKVYKKLTNGISESNKLVYTIWIMRICDILFKELAEVNTIPVLVLYGDIDKKFQAILPVLRELPLDIVHFATHKSYEVVDKGIDYYVVGSSTVNIGKYPLAMKKLGQVDTLAYNAERELNDILYDGVLLSRFKQFNGINPVVLRTTYEEVDILWNEPAKFRPSYNVDGNVVTIPTIFMKVNGVGKDKKKYLASLAKKRNEFTFIVNKFPYIKRDTGLFVDDGVISDNSYGLVTDDSKAIMANSNWSFDYDAYYEYSKHVIYNNIIDFDKIKNSRYWNYGVYSTETQELLCERIQNMLTLEWLSQFDKKIIYTVLTVLLNLEPSLVKLIHNFDFTSQIPKVIYFCTSEVSCSLEDCILLMFLKSIGFDALVYSPAGYTVIEKYIKTEQFTRVELGDYVFDISSDAIWNKLSLDTKKKGFFDFLFD